MKKASVLARLFPVVTVYNIGNLSLSNSELGSKFSLFVVSFCVKIPNVVRLFSGKFRLWISLTKRSVPPPFLHHISGVVFSGSKKQMVWVNATRIIASMTDALIRCNRPEMNHPGNAMSFNDSASMSVFRHGGIASAEKSNPLPAVSQVWSVCRDRSFFSYAIPKPFAHPIRNWYRGSGLHAIIQRCLSGKVNS